VQVLLAIAVLAGLQACAIQDWSALSRIVLGHGRLCYWENTAMSTRERWIVYPLLFLTLGIALRDKIVRPAATVPEELTAKLIHCGELRVDNTVSCGHLQSVLVQCFEMQTVAPGKKASVVVGTDPKNGAGVIRVLSPRGVPIDFRPNEPGAKGSGGPSPITPVTPNPSPKEKAVSEAK
jgi:hypothetical protein